jgi:hypothetical protein
MIGLERERGTKIIKGAEKGERDKEMKLKSLWAVCGKFSSSDVETMLSHSFLPFSNNGVAGMATVRGSSGLLRFSFLFRPLKAGRVADQLLTNILFLVIDFLFWRGFCFILWMGPVVFDFLGSVYHIEEELANFGGDGSLVSAFPYCFIFFLLA